MSRPSEHELLVEIARRTLRSVMLYQAMADRLGLGLKDVLCVTSLALDGAQTPGELARLLSVTSGGAITAVVNRLETAGLVRRTRDPLDGRRILVEAVPENLTALSAFLQQVSGVLSGRVADLPLAELELITGWLGAENSAAAHNVRELSA
ncbi:MarR family winged helix-turn-helix transcriptional regulator [Actinomadura roseirufa]|uniref:MarR family winged helix-turn-helix transcriptional regulator n=1 Tax=Actinomadura roseirufa TaxID=2094049 RepID=UPI001040F632|nr:MarR family transcriptional regulator [Actinomadura roseirufa]